LNILVAGGAGYIGSHLVKELQNVADKLVVLDDLSTGHRDSIGNIELVIGSSGNKALVTNILRTNNIDAVFYFAAHSLVGESMSNPGKYLRNNISFAIEFLESMVECGVRYMVFSSSAAVYGEPAFYPITEEHPTVPTNVYGATKLIFEEMLDWYDRIYGLKYVSLRYFNAAGADQSGQIGEDHKPETHLIPLVVKACMGLSEKIIIYGNDYPTKDGTCVRDYIHVSDLARAHILALKYIIASDQSKIYNLGNGTGYSVNDVIASTIKITGKKPKIEVAPRRPGDPAVLVASSKKIANELGWNPEYIKLEDIIYSAWNWHKNNPSGFQQ